MVDVRGQVDRGTTTTATAAPHTRAMVNVRGRVGQGLPLTGTGAGTHHLPRGGRAFGSAWSRGDFAEPDSNGARFVCWYVGAYIHTSFFYSLKIEQ